MPQASVTISAGSSYSVGTMATHRLPLLCRTTHNMSSDVHRLVREYLIVRVGKECTCVDDLLWWQDMGLQDMGADSDAAEPDADELIEVEFRVMEPKSCSWYVEQWHMGVYGSRFTGLLVMLREEFDGRVAGPGAHMQATTEAPSTEEEWRSFVQLWVFGPPKPAQGTLDRWLRPRA